METSLLLAVLGLLRLVTAQDMSTDKTKTVSISTTVTVDWLFTSPGVASPTPEPDPITIVSTIPYATYDIPPSFSSTSSEAYYPLPEESSESAIGTPVPTTSDSCNYYTVTSIAVITPTILVTTKPITITTMTTEAYSTIGAGKSSPSSSRHCTDKHDPNCADDHWGGLTKSQPPHETPPFTIVTSWEKRDVKTASGEGSGDLGFIGQEQEGDAGVGSQAQAWGLGIIVAGAAVMI